MFTEQWTHEFMFIEFWERQDNKNRQFTMFPKFFSIFASRNQLLTQKEENFLVYPCIWDRIHKSSTIIFKLSFKIGYNNERVPWNIL